MTDNDMLAKALQPLAKARLAFVEARERMNAAIPDVNGTPAERALYDERYKVDHEAERTLFSEALTFAAKAPDLLASLTTSTQSEEIDEVVRFLRAFSQADLDEAAADGGITVGMVFQQEARSVHVPRVERLTSQPSPGASYD